MFNDIIKEQEKQIFIKEHINKQISQEKVLSIPDLNEHENLELKIFLLDRQIFNESNPVEKELLFTKEEIINLNENLDLENFSPKIKEKLKLKLGLKIEDLI
jgi:hypothetical protein